MAASIALRWRINISEMNQAANVAKCSIIIKAQQWHENQSIGS